MNAINVQFSTNVPRFFSPTRRFMAVCCVCLTSTLTAGFSTDAFAEDSSLLNRIPGTANALMVIDATAVHNSPLAKKENWQKKHEEAYINQPIILPPEADRLVLASMLDPTDNMRQAWELAVMHLTEAVQLRSIARAEGGYIDTINGLQAVWTPSDAYFVELEDQVLGIMYPANRQLVSRWADFGQRSQEMVISSYLKQAADQAGKESPIVLAVDLTDMPRPHLLREKLEENELLKSAGKEKLDQVEALFLGVRGLTLRVHITDSIRGSLSLDFSDTVDPLGNLAKPLLLKTLDDFQAHLDDLESWSVRLEGSTVAMEGPLSRDGLRRILSLLEIPTTKFSTLDGEDTSAGSPEAILKASLTYFKSVDTLIQDLNKTLKENRDSHAVWMERYGRKIDRLPILNVDEDLLAFGAKTGETMRTMALAERGANVRAGVRKSGVYGSYQYNYSGTPYSGGYGSVQSTGSAKAQIQREESAQATQVRFESWKELEDGLAATRRQMTSRYKTEF